MFVCLFEANLELQDTFTLIFFFLYENLEVPTTYTQAKTEQYKLTMCKC